MNSSPKSSLSRRPLPPSRSIPRAVRSSPNRASPVDRTGFLATMIPDGVYRSDITQEDLDRQGGLAGIRFGELGHQDMDLRREHVEARPGFGRGRSLLRNVRAFRERASCLRHQRRRLRRRGLDGMAAGRWRGCRAQAACRRWDLVPGPHRDHRLPRPGLDEDRLTKTLRSRNLAIENADGGIHHRPESVLGVGGKRRDEAGPLAERAAQREATAQSLEAIA